MRRELGKEVKRRFYEQLKERLPQIVEIKNERNRLGWKVFEWALSPDVKAYLCLCLSPRDDTFTIEIACSRQDRFPGHLRIMVPHDIPRARIVADKPVDGEFLTRLPYLYSDQDKWWEVMPRLTVEEIMEQQRRLIETGQIEETPLDVGLERIEALVTDAVDRIVEYAVPWLVDQCRHSETI
ncbi:MAG TPA: hypothetical protein VG826_02945 [Pirellulales bacterium]|nr:hypothetical protein [Pirellulales bacterium]